MSIFNIQDARKDIFSMTQFAKSYFHKDILYFLNQMATVRIADDNLSQVVYLDRYPIMNPEEMDEEEIARLQKLNIKNIRALYVQEIIENFEKILDYFRFISDNGFRFIIPRKSEKVFREYLNIAVRYQIEHTSEAFENFATSIYSPRTYGEYMFVSEADMEVFIGRFTKLLNTLKDTAKDPLANFFSFDELKQFLCKRLAVLCRMSLPVRKDFEYYEEKDPILYKHVRAMNASYFKIYSTHSINKRFTLNHAFLMDKPIDIATIGYTEDAALFVILKAFIFKHIEEVVTGVNNVDDQKVQPDTTYDGK